MKVIKTILRYSIYLLIGLALAMALLPFVFKDRIVESIKEAANANLDATLDFEDVNLSLFRSFPDAQIGIQKLTITNHVPFDSKQLLSSKSIELDIDLPSLWSESRPYRINAISIVEPVIDIEVLKSGQANYAIFTSEDTSKTSYVLELDKYEIVDGTLHYQDRSSGLSAEIVGLNHTGSGSISEVMYDLQTDTDIGQVSIVDGGMPYIRKAHIQADIDLQVNQQTGRYDLQDNSIRINGLLVQADGSVQQLTDGMDLDLDISSGDATFAEVVSVLPFIGQQLDAKKITTNGSGHLDLQVRGTYNDTSYPAIDAQLELKEGMLAYDQADHTLSGVNLLVTIVSTRKDLSDLVVDIDPLQLSVDQQPFNGKIRLEDVMGSPSARGGLKGVLDLSHMAAAISNPDITTMAGVIEADLSFDIDAAAYEQGDLQSSYLEGFLRGKDLQISTTDMEPISMAALDVQFDKDEATIDWDQAVLGNSDITGNTTLSGLTNYLTSDGVLQVRAAAESRKVDLNPWMTADTTTSSEPTTDLSRYDIDIDYSAGSIQYDSYDIQNVNASVAIKDDNVNIKKGSAIIGDSDLALSGAFNGITDYLEGAAPLQGSMQVESQRLVMRDFTTESTTSTDTVGVVLIPEDMDLDVQFDVKDLAYDDLSLKQVNGSLAVQDQVATINQASARTLGGTMALLGSYDTRDADNPIYQIKYDVSQLQFADTYEAFAPIKAFAPIMKYVEGVFNSTLVMEGRLNQNMMPDLNSIDASGYIETLNGQLSGFTPVEKLANKLSVDELKRLAVENTKNWVEIKDGRLELKPVDVSYQGIDMVVSGSHALTTDMNYEVLLQLPREMLKGNAAGQIADSGIQFLENEASKLGLDLSAGDYIDLLVSIGGSITAPTFGIKPVSTSNSSDLKSTLKEAAANQVKATRKAVKDTVRSAYKKAETKARDTLDAAINKAKDTIQTEIDEQVEKAKDQATEKAKEIIKETAGQVVNDSVRIELEKKAEEVLGDKTKEEVDKIKDKLKDFNPFGKKKGGG